MTVNTDKSTKVQVLRLWPALAPFDVDIQKHFEAIAMPNDWFGVSIVPYYLMLQSELDAK